MKNSRKYEVGSRKDKVGSRQRKNLLTSYFLLLTVLMAGQSAFAEEQTDRYRLANLDGLGAVFGMARVEYQQNISEVSALALRGIFWHSNTESWKWDAYGGGFSYRRYITHKAPEGGWIGGGIDLMDLYAKYMGEKKRSYLIFPHAEAGYTFSFKDSKWMATPSLSLGNHITDMEISNSNIPISGAGMRLSVLLSYLF
ncbi:MAG: hypothetical protein HZA00_08870 [Nitrospinae bacterium]|nr:hypothetical protein [Nitrospinota bacterium]